MPESDPLLVRACRREAVERTPVWFMRQAGRSLPEYRALREQHGFFELAGNPELCAEVTLQPVRRHDVDAAVMFADIMTPVAAMGIGVELVEGVGPVIADPIRTAADVERLHVAEPPSPVLEAVRIVRAELAPDKAVVGFCGGPFTVAGYLVEGKPSRDFLRVKALMHGEPVVWHALMEVLTNTSCAYVCAKVAAGADLRLHVGRERVGQAVHEGVPDARLAVHQRLHLDEVAARTPLDQIARGGEGPAAEADHRLLGRQFRPDEPNGVEHPSKRVRLRQVQPLDVGRSADRMLDHRPDALDQRELDPHGGDRGHDVREHHGRVDVVPTDGLQRDLRAQLGALGDLEERVPLAQRPVLGQ